MQMYEFKGEKLLKHTDFTEVIWLTLRSSLPTKEQKALLDAVLTVGLELHRRDSAEATVRVMIRGGAPMSAAVGAGLQVSGTTVTAAGHLLAHSIAGAPGRSRSLLAHETVDRYLRQRRFVPGFGRYNERVFTLLHLADRLGVRGHAVALAEAIERDLRLKNRDVYLTLEGSMAALLLDLGFSVDHIRSIVLIARTVGLVGYVNGQRESNQ